MAPPAAEEPPHLAPRLLPLGDAAWTLVLGDSIHPTTHERVQHLVRLIEAERNTEALWAHVTDVVPTFRSLTVYFSPLLTHADALGERLLCLAKVPAPTLATGRHWRLPLCCDPEFSPDLPLLSQTRRLDTDTVMERFLSTDFRVYMIGFLPGFPYMGGLPPELAMPRRASPRTRVPAQSVAVAGEMCAVYPWDSPGGWNLLGRTPVPMFDPRDPEHPALLSAGDHVDWYWVNRQTHDELSRALHNGDLKRTAFLTKDSPA